MPPMLAAEPEPLSEREEAGGDEDELRGSVARPLVRHPAREERRRRGRGGGQREEEPGTSRQADREVVEDVAGLAGNGRLDSRCSVRGGSRGREAEAAAAGTASTYHESSWARYSKAYSAAEASVPPPKASAIRVRRRSSATSSAARRGSRRRRTSRSMASNPAANENCGQATSPSTASTPSGGHSAEKTSPVRPSVAARRNAGA